MKINRSVCFISAVGLLASALVLTKAFAGSPFYLTVEKSFSSSEKPEVRLDYADSSKPLSVRVLRPKSLERFLDGQLHISRSYEQPVSELNPGHYFVKGLNKVESPLKSFREMLDGDFRKSFHDTSFNKAIRDTAKGDLASTPEEVIQRPPAELTVVRELFVDLQFGGASANDLGWWLAGNTWEEDRYKIRKITLDPLPDGVYLIQAVQGKTEAQCLMQVSSLAVQVKQSTEQLVVRAIDRSQAPVAGATVSYRDGRGKWITLGQKTDSSGEVAFSNPEGILDGKLVIKTEAPDHRQALVDTDFIPAVTNDDSVFIVTDRPIFKPGETFFYKGLVRAFDNGELKAPTFADPQVRITLISSDNKSTDIQATAALTDFGSFSGSLGLDETQSPGLYRLVAEIDGKPYGGEFRVRDYVKPTFYLELMDRSPTIIPGEKFSGKFKAKRYSGGAPKKVKYEVFLYRKKFEAPQWVFEAGAGLSAGRDYYGEIKSAASLMEPKRIYSSVEARLAARGESYVTNSWDTAPEIDENGEASFELDIPKAGSSAEEEWIYTLMVRAFEPGGSQAVLTENIFMTLSEAQPVVRFSTAITKVKEKGLSVGIRSTYPDGKPAPRAGGVVDIKLELGKEEAGQLVKLPFSTDDQGVCQIALPDLTRPGKLSAVATLETLDGKALKHPARSQPAVMIVGGAQGEKVLDNRELELYTAATVLSPGEKAKVFALLPANWGKAESGTVWETISGRKVYETKPSQLKGRSSWFEVEAKAEYGTGFYHTITVPMSGGKYREQTLGFRIIPWSKRLNVSIFPQIEETEPLKPFKIDLEVKDSKGEPSPNVELAVTIVDRAVYAVQSELRPGIFDFFYPLPRLNLATFYSDELQGYGYADILKKPNFKLGALKSRSRLTKKAMRDTAGWLPHVVTDAQGRASVTVDLPANVTEWLITAIAADKGGRVGEGKGGFRTVSDVSVEAVAPQFLRQGEEAALQIKTVNQLRREVSLEARLELSGEASLEAGKLEGGFTLEPQGENLWPLVIRSNGRTGAATVKVALEPQEKVHVGGVEEFEISLKPAAMRQVFSGAQQKDRLVTPLPETGKVGEAKIQVYSGLLGAALNAAPTLASYPYGCTEQLVHTTIPNLVLLDLVRRAGLGPDDLGPLAEVLSKAQRNAELGVRKIVLSQKSNGGFGLWPSDESPSLAVTLTALHALKLARDLKIEGTKGPFNKGVDWLAALKDEPLEAKGALLGYELALLAETGVDKQPWEQQIAFVEGLLGENKPAASDCIYALKIFEAYKEQSWNRFNENFSDESAKNELIEKLKKALYGLDPEFYLWSARREEQVFDLLGLGFGIPSIVSAGMGVLEDLKALPEDLEARLERILLSSTKNGYWTSTFDTAQVIFNTRGILSKEAEAYAREVKEKTRRIVAYRKDGSQLGELSRIPAGFVGKLADPGTAQALSEIRLEGLKPSEIATSAMTVDVPYESVKPRSQGLVVERALMRITAKGSEPLDLSKPLNRGDLVVSEIRVRRGPAQGVRTLPSQFLVVEDGVPSLAQSIDDDRAHLADAGIKVKDDSYWSWIKETKRYPEKTVRIARVPGQEELKTYQVWRVAFTGKAAIPPAHAFDMYDESIEGSTGAQSMRVE